MAVGFTFLTQGKIQFLPSKHKAQVRILGASGFRFWHCFAFLTSDTAKQVKTSSFHSALSCHQKRTEKCRSLERWLFHPAQKIPYIVHSCACGLTLQLNPKGLHSSESSCTSIPPSHDLFITLHNLSKYSQIQKPNRVVPVGPVGQKYSLSSGDSSGIFRGYGKRAPLLLYLLQAEHFIFRPGWELKGNTQIHLC